VFNIALQGFIQGLSEFLPISSSGHLTLFQFFTGRNDLQANLQADIALHFGTLLAVIFFFRHDLKSFVTISGWRKPEIRRLALLIILGSIPAAILGIALKKHFESLFACPQAVCIFLFITGLLLLLAEKLKCKAEAGLELHALSGIKAFIIGIAQGLAITPGISRSGSTISAGLLFGLKGESAAKFSFFLMIPAVGGATLLEIKDFMEKGSSLAAPSELLTGALISCITGFAALKLLVYMIKQQKLSIFSYYLFALSIISLIAINLMGKPL
jgi:undecaprenyl-diphosphatase